jgi:hypothetical protein
MAANDDATCLLDDRTGGWWIGRVGAASIGIATAVSRSR